MTEILGGGTGGSGGGGSVQVTGEAGGQTVMIYENYITSAEYETIKLLRAIELRLANIEKKLTRGE